MPEPTFHSAAGDFHGWLQCWDAVTFSADQVRNLLYSAARGRLTHEQSRRLQLELEFIRVVAGDRKLDTLFLSPDDFAKDDAMTDCPSIDLDVDISGYIRELSQMYLEDPACGTETESACIGSSTMSRTTQIGQELHRIGGKMAMLRAHDAILAEHGTVAANMLRLRWSWDKVGNWMR
jgi:hypothetical protein